MQEMSTLYLFILKNSKPIYFIITATESKLYLYIIIDLKFSLQNSSSVLNKARSLKSLPPQEILILNIPQSFTVTLHNSKLRH